MKLQKAIALRISNLLAKNQLSRYKLCKKICMSQQTLKNIIDERNNNIRLSTIAYIAEGFNITLSEFFDDSLFQPNTYEIE